VIALCSPSYATGTYTIRELEAYATGAPDPGGLFPIELLPPASFESYHPEIRKRPVFAFWRRDDVESFAAITLDPALHTSDYHTKLNDIAGQIAGRLTEMAAARAAPDAAAAPPPRPAPQQAAGTVLLAQTTDDLDGERSQLKSYLAGAGIRVLPEADYPQGGAQFRAAYAADLAGADLMVHLVGRAAGRMPSDLPEGYQRYQYETAVAAGTPIMGWKHPELDLGQVADAAHRALLDAEHFAAMQFETFKEDVGPFVEGFCIRCHGPRPKAGVNLKSALQSPGSASSFLHWKKAVANVKVHDMPPEDSRRQPSDEQRAQFIEWIGKLKYLSPKDPGPFVIRRLNKAEYANTLHALYGVPPSIADGLPSYLDWVAAQTSQ